jgi:hypothetical protein
VLLLRRGLLPARRFLDMDSELAFRLVFIDRSGWLMLLPADASVFFLLVIYMQQHQRSASHAREERGGGRRKEEEEGEGTNPGTR